MKKIKNWVKKNSAILSIALSNVEKNALSQTNELISTDINQTIRLNQGKISDSLINGEITQEVKDLRWRTYKILESEEKVKIILDGYDENGDPIYVLKEKNIKISKPIIDNVDPYELEMVVDNSEICDGNTEAVNINNIKKITDSEIRTDTDGDKIQTIAEVKGVDYFTKNKNEKPIKIIRNLVPNFYLEEFTKVVKIRKVNDNKRMLEFYISIYPDEYNRNTRLLLSTIKKQIQNPLFGDTMLKIDEVEFITNKTQGAHNNLKFVYNNIVFDKIIEFNGHYVIKFLSDIKINGQYIFDEFRENELELKYQNKTKK